MTIDPKTTLTDCATLMLDMDGTVLDLAYDNYVWKELVPARFAARHGVPIEHAKRDLYARYRAAQGNLEWYCLDHWSERLGFDVVQVHRDVGDRIDYLPGAAEFLTAAQPLKLKILLVTNSHPDTLALKHEMTQVGDYFDGVFSAHNYGFAKEQQEFWRALHADVSFDPETTVFVDDSVPVLRSAAEFGIRTVVEVTRPDTTRPSRDQSEFEGIEQLPDLLRAG